MAFHGYNGSGEHMSARIGLNADADTEGFILVFPNGVDGAWNDGTCCEEHDDVAFARAVLADVSNRLCVDPSRVYATGLSNGGGLCYRLACDAADLFAAIAPVSAVLPIPPETCKPSRPISVIEFHGTADSIVPYDGGGAPGLPSAPATFEGWAERDRCTDETPAQTYAKGTASCDTYSQCADGTKVTLCTIDGGGHCWAGETTCKYGAVNQDISANDAMWHFFSQFSLPPP